MEAKISPTLFDPQVELILFNKIITNGYVTIQKELFRACSVQGFVTVALIFVIVTVTFMCIALLYILLYGALAFLRPCAHKGYIKCLMFANAENNLFKVVNVVAHLIRILELIFLHN